MYCPDAPCEVLEINILWKAIRQAKFVEQSKELFKGIVQTNIVALKIVLATWENMTKSRFEETDPEWIYLF